MSEGWLTQLLEGASGYLLLVSGDELVSVIVPVYRVEEYLDRCVSSLRAQTHATLEIILVDDGSPDQCGRMCDEYLVADSRIRVIHQDNSGPSAARNAGIEMATGAYIAFVDPDDWIHREMIATLVDLINRNDADVAVCQFLHTESENVGAARLSSDAVRLSRREALALYAGPHADIMTSSCAKLFHASLFDEIRFPVGKYYEDEFTIHRLVSKATRIVLNSSQLYYYFSRPGSATRQIQDARRLFDRGDAQRQRGQFFREIGMDRVSAESYRKAFYFLRRARQVARHHEVSPQLVDQIEQDAIHVARAIGVSSLAPSARVSSGVFLVAPVLLELVSSISRVVRQSHGRKGSSTLGGKEFTPFESPAAPDLRPLDVIVVAYGHPEMLSQALMPLAASSITVVDNSSLSEIAHLCRELGCRYLDPGKNGGFAAGVNIGLANRLHADGDVLLLNPDAVISAESVSELHSALLAEPDLASVGPAQFDGNGIRSRVYWPFHSPLNAWLDAVGLWRIRDSACFVMGSVLLLRKEAIEQIGFFDERFFLYFEETDWAYRAHRAGWRHKVVETVVASHVGGGTSDDRSERDARFSASEEKYFRKHYGAIGWHISRVGKWVGHKARAVLRVSALGNGQPEMQRPPQSL